MFQPLVVKALKVFFVQAALPRCLKGNPTTSKIWFTTCQVSIQQPLNQKSFVSTSQPQPYIFYRTRTSYLILYKLVLPSVQGRRLFRVRLTRRQFFPVTRCQMDQAGLPVSSLEQRPSNRMNNSPIYMSALQQTIKSDGQTLKK